MNKYTLSGVFGLLMVVLWFSCKSDQTASTVVADAAATSRQDSLAAPGTPVYPKVDLSRLRQLSFKETYLYGMKNQGAFRFPVYDEDGNEIPTSQLAAHFSANRGMIMYADETGEVKAGVIRTFTEAEINEILQISREIKSGSGSLNSNSTNTN
ncbi:MAG TPA: hypothetical protein VFX48_03845 [Saprospiraceae bacterium]|nr:hypothetical protein [Saprospiraceae bacterium]